MRECLYRSDYGPADPTFDPNAVASVRGYESWQKVLLQAWNADQLAAMKRRIDHGESFVWCDQGYGWVTDPGLEGFFAILLAILVPFQAFRLLKALAHRKLRTDRCRGG